ncbi:MAG: peptidoglycan DD-metalloendopeptidase family protein [Acidimicrobiales bacterium]|nr:peptidoglycan DD-metalloendopeptidase family protein [Acidimicrobiales bacterium]
MKRAAAAAIALLLAVVLLAPAGAAPGQPAPRGRQDDIQQEIARLREQYDEALADEADLLAGIEVARGREQALSARVAELDASLATVQAERADAQRRLDQAQARADQARTQLAGTRRQLEEASDLLAERAVDAYVGGGPASDFASIALQGGDLADLQTRASYTSWLAAEQRTTIDRRKALEEDARIRSDQLEAARSQIQAQRDLVAEREAQARALRDEQEAARREAEAEVDRQASLIAEVEARRGQYEQRIAALQQESDAVAAALRARSGSLSTGPAVQGSGQLAFPVPGYSVGSRRFGVQVHPIYGTPRMHSGVDIGAPTGAPVRAADDGVVVSADVRGGYGNCIVIDHGDGLATLYAHLSAMSVGAGESVTRGQVIGAIGSTGASTGPHLHFEVRVNGNPVDPLPYL